MSRTYRRRGQRHEYRWVLRDSIWIEDVLVTIFVDAHSKQGRRVIARFHSDAYWTLRSTAPRWYRGIFEDRLRRANLGELRRWLEDPGHDPVFQARHRHSANWSWW